MVTPPEPLKRVFHYANARPTEKTWRRVVLGPVAQLVLPPRGAPPPVPTFGVRSLAELESILAGYRTLLSRWTSLESAYSEDAATLLHGLNEGSRLVFKGWGLSADTERLVEQWNTGNASFTELLYSLLAMALKEVSFRAIHRCEACEQFFYAPSRRRSKFCSARCRNRATVRRYRARHAGATQPRRRRPSRRRSHGRKSAS